MTYYIPPAGGSGLTIGDVKADPDIADSLTKKHTRNLDEYLNNLPGNVFYTDVKRVDTYTETGTITNPFKTIQAAINKVISNGNNTQSNPYVIKINPGIYLENLILEHASLVSLIIIGLGSRLQVQINPASGYALQSTANNGNLADLHIENIQFIKPTTMVGSANGTFFGFNHFFIDTYWPSTAMATFKNMVYPTFSGIVTKFSGGLLLSNITQCSINNIGGFKTGAFTIETDENANKPNLFGTGTAVIVSGGTIANTTWSLLNITTSTGTALQVRGARHGSAGETIPLNATIIAYNSTLVGNYVNNGTLSLYNSQVTGTITGNAPELYNFATQIKNVPAGTIASTTVQAAINELDGDNATKVTLGGTFAVNQAFQLAAGVTIPITSLDVDCPAIDGVILEAGILNAIVNAAMIQGNRYTTTVTLPTQEQLWLGQNGKITGAVPTSLAGDVWMVSLGHRDDATHFVFDPQDPIKL
jgi:hypothetical protein